MRDIGTRRTSTVAAQDETLGATISPPTFTSHCAFWRVRRRNDGTCAGGDTLQSVIARGACRWFVPVHARAERPPRGQEHRASNLDPLRHSVPPAAEALARAYAAMATSPAIGALRGELS